MTLLARTRAVYDYAGGAVMWLRKKQQARLLDVGSGSGEFLARMRGLGWEVEGREFDPQAVEFSRSRYFLKVSQGGLPGPELAPESFDAVTLSHVIEHVPVPSDYFAEAFRLLKAGGRLAIVTPNRHSLGHFLFGIDWRGLEPPRHFQIFSRGRLANLAEQAGFSVVEVRSVSRTARQIWRESEKIRARRLRRSPRPWVLACAVPFQIFESIFDSFFEWGEEVLLVAEKKR